MDAQGLQADLNTLAGWSARNLMELNVAKCETITFSRKSESHGFSGNYTINSEVLKKSNVIRDLGVLLDSKLNFKSHVDHIVSRARMMLGFVKRQARDFQCPYVTKSLFCSLVRSTLEYCSVVWSPCFAVDVKKIESVQKQFLLFALRNLPWQHRYVRPPYNDRLMLLGMVSLERRRRISDCLFVFDVLRKRIKVPEINALIVVREPLRSTRSAENFQLQVPFTSTSYEANDPIVRSCRTFNIIAYCYDATCSREVFRQRIDRAL